MSAAEPFNYDLPADQNDGASQEGSVGGHPLGRDHGSCETHGVAVPVEPSPLPKASAGPPPMSVAPWEADALLLLASDVFDDVERVRMAMENRLLALVTSPKAGEKGGTFGKGISPDAPEARFLESVVKQMKAIEHGVDLEMRRAMRKHPLVAWVKSNVGIGEKQGARLIAAIGDPYWNDAANRPRRGPAELWAYCGYHVLHPGRQGVDAQMKHTGVDLSASGQDDIGSHDVDAAGSSSGSDAQGTRDPHSHRGVAPRRAKGQKANWNSTAKMRAYNVAVSCMKNRRSPYRAVFDARRAHTAVTHPEWTPLHSQNDALRVTAKAILRDLFVEAKRLHEALLDEEGGAGGASDDRP